MLANTVTCGTHLYEPIIVTGTDSTELQLVSVVAIG